MPSRKITDYAELTSPANNDMIPIVDVSEALASNKNKRIAIPNLTSQLSAASTSAAGIVQLNDTISSTSVSQAATANAAKTAYDLAVGKAALTRQTVQNSTSGTVIDFTGIPSTARLITVMLSGVSTNGSSSVIVQLGSTSFTTSGYLGASIITGSTGAATNLSSGFRIHFNLSDAAAAVRHGSMVLSNITGNTWVANGSFGLSDSAWISTVAGTIALGGTLDRVRVTTINGTDTFDAGSINLIYQG